MQNDFYTDFLFRFQTFLLLIPMSSCVACIKIVRTIDGNDIYKYLDDESNKNISGVKFANLNNKYIEEISDDPVDLSSFINRTRIGKIYIPCYNISEHNIRAWEEYLELTKLRCPDHWLEGLIDKEIAEIKWCNILPKVN